MGLEFEAKKDVIWNKGELLALLDREVEDEDWDHRSKYVNLKQEFGLGHWRRVSMEQLLDKGLFKKVGPHYRETLNKLGKTIWMFNYLGGGVLSITIRGLDVKEFLDISLSGSDLYGIGMLRKGFVYGDPVICVEGVFDREVMQLYLERMGRADIYSVVATKGVSLTERKANLLRCFTDTVVFSGDNDVAGREGVRKGIERWKAVPGCRWKEVPTLARSGGRETKDIGDCLPLNDIVTEYLKRELDIKPYSGV